MKIDLSKPKIPCRYCGSKNVQYFNKPMSEVTVKDEIFQTHKDIGEAPFFEPVFIYCNECKQEAFVEIL